METRFKTENIAEIPKAAYLCSADRSNDRMPPELFTAVYI
jgi:hypothetical protein